MEPWKKKVLRQLRERNLRETGSFKQLILSHGRLLDQVEGMKTETTRLEFNINELEKELRELRKEGGGAGGGNAQNARLSKKVEDLQEKLMQKTEELSDALRSRAELSAQVAELTKQIKDKEMVVGRKDSEIKTFMGTVEKLQDKNAKLEKELEQEKKTTSKLRDDHTELEVEFTAQTKAIKDLQTENDRLRVEVLKMKTAEAERINTFTELEKQERDRMIQRQIEKAAQPRRPPSASSPTMQTANPQSRRRSSSSTRAASTASLPLDIVDPHAVLPAIIPDKPFFTTEAHDGEVAALTFSPDGNYIATGGADKVVKIWNIRPTEEKVDYNMTLHGCSASVLSVQFDSNSKYLLASSNDFAARIWSVTDQRIRHTLTGHSAKVYTAKFLDDGVKIVTGSQDKTLKLWDLRQRKCIKTLFAGSSCCDLVHAHVLGNMIISGHWDRKLRFWDMRTSSANPNHELAIQGRVTSLSLFPDRYMLLCSTRDDSSLRLIDLRQNSITSTFTGFHLGIDWARAAFSPDGQYVAVGGSDGSIYLWESLTGRQHKARKDNRPHTRDVVACCWHPMGQAFASVDRNKKLVVWKR